MLPGITEGMTLTFAIAGGAAAGGSIVLAG